MNSDNPLSAIPVIECPPGEEPAVVSALAEPERLALLMASARRTYTPPGLNWADARSRAWAGRSSSPYGDSVRKVDSAVGRRGAFLLNYSYEWDGPGLGKTRGRDGGAGYAGLTA